jgi:hypothetical protein
MKRRLVILTGAAVAVTLAACSDESSPPQQAAVPGEGGVTRAERPEADAKVPEVEKGVVPDLLGASYGTAQEAIKKAGFKEGDVEGGLGVGTYFPTTLEVCEQAPEPGASPKEGTKIDLDARVKC